MLCVDNLSFEYNMTLDILTKGPSFDWSEDNLLHGRFKTWRKKVELLTKGMELKKEPVEFVCHSIKVWSGETCQTHIEAVDLSDEDVKSTKKCLDVLEQQCKPRSSEIVAATAYKQLVPGEMGLHREM